MSVERLITQLESTTSTRAGGERDRLDVALEPVHVAHAGLGLVGAGQLEHLVGHVQAVGGAGRADAARGEQHVDAAARAEVEHRLALLELGDRERVAAAQRGQQRGVGQLAAFVGRVQRGAELLGLLVGDERGVGSAAVGGLLAGGDLRGGGGVALAHRLAQRVRVGASGRRRSRTTRPPRRSRSRPPSRTARSTSAASRAHNNSTRV